MRERLGGSTQTPQSGREDPSHGDNLPGRFFMQHNKKHKKHKRFCKRILCFLCFFVALQLKSREESPAGENFAHCCNQVSSHTGFEDVALHTVLKRSTDKI